MLLAVGVYGAIFFYKGVAKITHEFGHFAWWAFAAALGSSDVSGVDAIGVPAARAIASTRGGFLADPRSHGERRAVWEAAAFVTLFCNLKYESPLHNLSAQRAPHSVHFGYSDNAGKPGVVYGGGTLGDVMAFARGASAAAASLPPSATCTCCTGTRSSRG